MGSIFRTEGLSAGYGRKAVLSGAEITAERGRITTLIGPNGCGKSTLLRTAAKQLEPLAGTVFISGKSLRETGANELARKLSILLTDRVSPELMTCRDVWNPDGTRTPGGSGYSLRRTGKRWTRRWR